MDSVDWNGGLERWNGMVEWTGLYWNGMAGCNFSINFCGRDQTLTCIQAATLARVYFGGGGTFAPPLEIGFSVLLICGCPPPPRILELGVCPL